MRIVIIFFIGFILICSCNTEPDPDILFKEKLSGYAQKGPFINGTSITIFSRNSGMEQTGDVFSTQIANNHGYFELQDLKLEDPFAELRATGYYFNEVSGENSASQLTLYALADLQDASSINVNLLTHLEIERIKFLIENGQSFSEAKLNTFQEVLSAFGLEKTGMTNPEALDISLNTDDNARLLAVSAILQGNRTVADLSEFLANIKSDMREDGIISSEALKADLYSHATNLNPEEISSRLQSRYDDLGFTREVPDFSTHLEAFLELYNPFEVSATVKHVSCNPVQPGSVSLQIVSKHPPYTIIWSNGKTTADINNLTPGIYVVQIKDSYGYVFEEQYQIEDGYSVDAEVLHATEDGSDGRINLSVSGGTEPYTYSWSTGSNGPFIENLSTGQYAVTISDATGCKISRSFPVKGELIDTRDNHLYKIIRIGDQIWMAENLNVGDLINGDVMQSDNDIIEKHCIQNKELNCDEVGGAYQWYELMNHPVEPVDDSQILQGICPEGWHVPNRDEWQTLIDFLGGSDVAGGKLKEQGGNHWWTPNVGATDEVGFTAIPSGDILVPPENHGEFADFWTSSPEGEGILVINLESFSTRVNFVEEGKEYSRTVRCIKD